MAEAKLKLDTSNAMKSIEDLTLELKHFKKEMNTSTIGSKRFDEMKSSVDKTTASLNRATGATKKMSTGLANMAKLIGGAFAVTSIIRFGKEMLNVIFEFQEAQSVLASILGTTSDNIKELTTDAKKLGASTAFTAKQVSELQTELAKLGFSKKEILNSTEGILNLAAATGTDLANAATIAGSALRAFNLDASEMDRVTNVLGVVTTKSALDMEKLKTSLATVGSTANAAGFSIEETTSMLGKLVDSGLDASSAGTHLRKIFIELNDKGLSLSEGLKQISSSNNKLGASTELFGKRAAGAGLILANLQGETGLLTNELENLDDELKLMAEERLDNVKGSATKLSSAWEGAILNFDDGNGIISETIKLFLDMDTAIIAAANTYSDMKNTLADYNKEQDDTLNGTERMVRKISDFFTGTSGKILLFTKSFEKMGDKVEKGEIKYQDAIKEIRTKALEQNIVLTDEDFDIFNKMWKSKTKVVEDETAKQKEIEQNLTIERIQTLKADLEEYSSVKITEEQQARKALNEQYKKDIELLKSSKVDESEALKQLTKKYNEDQQKITEKYNKKSSDKAIENAKKQADELLKLEQENFIASIEDKQEREQTALYIKFLNESDAHKDQYDYLLQLQEKYERESANIDKKWADKKAEDDAARAERIRIIQDDEITNEIQSDIDADNAKRLLGLEGFEKEREQLRIEADYTQMSKEELAQKLKEIDEKERNLQQASNLKKVEDFQNTFSSLLSLTQAFGEESKAARIAMVLSQFAIDTASSISSLMASSTANPLNSVTFGTAGAIQFAAGMAQIAVNAAQATSALSKAEDGMMVGGRRHAQGGTIIEAEDGEMVMNRRSVAMFPQTLSNISQAGNGIKIPGTKSIEASIPNINYGNLITPEMPMIKVGVYDRDITDQQIISTKVRDRAKF